MNPTNGDIQKWMTEGYQTRVWKLIKAACSEAKETCRVPSRGFDVDFIDDLADAGIETEIDGNEAILTWSYDF